MHAETVDQLVSLCWKQVLLGYLETGKRTTTKVYALLAVSYLRTELQLRITWYFAGLTRDEYDSEERRRVRNKKCS